MSQKKIESYFRFRASKTLIFESHNIINIKSEMGTPLKIPKLEVNEKINLISDDEESPSKTNELLSDTTIVYTPEKQSPNTSFCSRANNVVTALNPRTDSDSDSHNSIDTTPKVIGNESMSSTSNSSLSGKKYFSPHKKRSLTVKTITKGRKKLNLSECNEQDLEPWEGLDDKTMFFMNIINQCLNDKDLLKLLDECSQNLLMKCCDLSNHGSSIELSGLHLVCRLYWRKERWYREEELHKIVSHKKPHIKNIVFKPIIDRLLQIGLLVTSDANCGRNVISFNDYYNLLKGLEVKAICKQFKIPYKTKKAALSSLRNLSKQKSIENFFVEKSSSNFQRVLEKMRKSCGDCYKLSDEARKTLHDLYNLVYLGIEKSILSENKLELTLINDKANIETYPVRDLNCIDNATVVFKTRHQFQSYIAARTKYEEFIQTTDSLKRCGIIEFVYKQYMEISKSDMASYMSLSVWLRRFTPAYIYIKILEGGLPDLKKQHQKEKYCQLAVEILTMMVTQTQFRQHKKAEWYTEIALIYDKCLNNSDKAAETVWKAFRELDIPDYQKDCLRTRARMLMKRGTKKPAGKFLVALWRYASQAPAEKDIPATHIHKKPMENFGRGKKKFVRQLHNGMEVMDAEEYCKMYYIQQGIYTHGEHWEGAIITTIFALLFWDVIYAELRGVRGIFLTRYQKYPLDMFSEAFYYNRTCLIEAKLNYIEMESITQIIENMKNVWDSRPEYELSDIQRGKRMNFENVAAVCKCLGNMSLAAICRRLAMDYTYCHSGFPDLTLWNPNTNQIIFVEVKTDTDSASMKQIQWMKYLQSIEINTELCYIGAYSA